MAQKSQFQNPKIKFWTLKASKNEAWDRSQEVLRKHSPPAESKSIKNDKGSLWCIATSTILINANMSRTSNFKVKGRLTCLQSHKKQNINKTSLSSSIQLWGDPVSNSIWKTVVGRVLQNWPNERNLLFPKHRRWSYQLFKVS